MYRGYIFIVVLIFLCDVILGMGQETSLQLQKPTCQIPVLYINNYVVNVSSAYKALKRETFLTYSFMKNVGLEIMSCRVKREIPVTSWSNSLARRSYIKHSRPAEYPNFICLHVLCTKSSQNQEFDITMDTVPYVYCTDNREFKWIPCPETEDIAWGYKADRWLCRLTEVVLNGMIDRGFKGSWGVELHYPNRISDWLIIEKNC